MVANSLAPLVVIVGPTASGKSDLAMLVAKKSNGEIICADSRTIYKGLDIGTAKPSLQDQAEVRHHLLDIRLPNQAFSVAEFKTLAYQAIADIWQRGKLPILVGGSGLYIDAVLFDFTFGPPANLTERAKLEALSVEELQDTCRQLNIELPQNYLNKRYLVRVIERGDLLQRNHQLRPNTFVVGIATNKDALHARVEKRAQAMVKQGVLQEVANLGKQYGWDSEAAKGNIYRIFRRVVENELTLEEAVKQFVQSDMRLIKKQLTWFKRNKYILWGTAKELEQKIAQFAQQYSR